MPRPAPEEDVAAQLRTLLDLDDTEIKCGVEKEPGPPGQPNGNEGVVIWVAPYGGSIQHYLDRANAGALYLPRVQITVLGPQRDERAGLALARQAIDGLDAKPFGIYSGVKMLGGSGDPIWGGFNSVQQPRYWLNVELTFSAVL